MAKEHMTREKIESLCMDRIGEALERDQFDDVAKLAKDTLSIFYKQDQTRGAQEALRFQMVASFAEDGERRHYVEQTQPQIRRVLETAPKKVLPVESKAS